MDLNVRQALQILDIGYGYKDIKDIPYSAIKTAYRKQALMFHPDKNKSDDANELFIEIKTAFDVLTSAYESDEAFFHSGDHTDGGGDGSENLFNGFYYNYDYNHNYDANYADTDDADSYKGILFSFLKNVVGKDTFTKIQNNIFFMVIDKITNSCKDQIVKIITKIDTETIIKIYSLIIKHREILHINDDIISLINKIITERIETDTRVVVYPNLEDIFKKNLYVLTENDKKYYIPTWCSELIYDTSFGELTVACLPITPDGVYLDDDNNVHISATFNITDIVNKVVITIKFLDYWYNINVSELYIRQTQIVKKAGLGIPKFNPDDIYDVSANTDLIIHLTITNIG